MLFRSRFSEHLSPEVRCPVLLHIKHTVTQLIILDAHEKELLHIGGASSTMSKLSDRYLIPKQRRVVRVLINRCWSCRRRNARPPKQEEAPVPSIRTGGFGDSVCAFHHIALDAGGPFEVKVGRGKTKVWLLVFVCLTFKCVHLEVIDSMDGSSFLMAFFRFVSRRGRPRTVLSDNGTNFVLDRKSVV